MSRNNAIDVAKGLGILAVVFGHNWIVRNENRELFRVIFSFHMPLFLFISGVFIRNNTTAMTYFWSKFNSLIKPCFVIMSIVCFIALLRRGVDKGMLGAEDFLMFFHVLYGTGATLPWVPLWFLPHLCVASVSALLIIKALKGMHENFIPLVAMIMLVLGIPVLRYFSENDLAVFGFVIKSSTGLPWSFDLTPVTSAFLLLGYYARENVKSFSFSRGGFVFQLFCFLFFILSTTKQLT